MARRALERARSGWSSTARSCVRRCAGHPDEAFFFRVSLLFDDFMHHFHPSMHPRWFLELKGGDLEECACREPHDGIACFKYVDTQYIHTSEQ